MTAVMRHQPGLAPNAPSGRQDVISALLNDYGNSFGGGNGNVSPYALSPVPTFTKELPPPPPLGGDDKPLPPVMMQFQLRVDEPRSPLHYNGGRKDSVSSSSPPTKIVSRSMSRSSKPPSLRLLSSNGSTATLPSTPRPNANASSRPITPATASTLITTTRRSSEERPLPDLPPPPPEKSKRRSWGRSDSSMGISQPKVSNDGLQEQQGSKPLPVVKRKPLQTLADLSGPRGRKMGAKPPTAVVQNQSESTSNTTPVPTKPEPIPEASQTHPYEDFSPRKAVSGDRPALSTIPTTLAPSPLLDEPEPATRSVMQAPRPFVGLPARPSPRPRQSQDAEPTLSSSNHHRGKSSTGFDIFKGTNKFNNPAPLNTSNNSNPNPSNNTRNPNVVNTLTPSPTPPAEQSPPPSNQVQNQQRQEQHIQPVKRPDFGPESPVSPISPPREGRRPFSFEPVAIAPRSNPNPAAGANANARSVSPISPPLQTVPAPRSQSQPQVQLQSQPQPQPQPQHPTSKSISFPTRTTSIPQHPSAPSPSSSPKTPPPYIRPSHLPAPPLNRSHYHCYHSHAHFNISSNRFAPMGCQVCHHVDKLDRWACTWCYLRICGRCKTDLERVPGRKVEVLEERRRAEMGSPRTVVSVVLEGDEGLQ
ncbi:uncharacterized protein BDR25DRAFT_300338 [Lindgomyces ingoldianus]|uniref:Uncharacterized protein n=1 Tax=Lindgomyces ingoldianus TaxID=673940 RepID=A0ACB6RAC1_9PLEO|nr:uncharacterized protein BDR25DRAFT_300338 [Lindgomyces ingoldianus]KAF2476233.1 hypothetical protein BDR25DRAFT_300338 [Lindgomyces ingoldianus]